MRRSLPWARSLLAALLSLLPGCNSLDAFAPLDLVPGKGLSGDYTQAISGAAECWNLAFGTRMRGTWSPTASQQVPIESNPFACVNGQAGITLGAPKMQVHICAGITEPAAFFGVVLHELGHVLSIWDHVEAPQAVMNMNAYMERNNSFTDADLRAFEEANGPARPACTSVKILPGKLGCTCQNPNP